MRYTIIFRHQGKVRQVRAEDHTLGQRWDRGDDIETIAAQALWDRFAALPSVEMLTERPGPIRQEFIKEPHSSVKRSTGTRWP